MRNILVEMDDERCLLFVTLLLNECECLSYRCVWIESDELYHVSKYHY